MLCSDGIESFLKMMMRGTTSDVSVAGDYYVGICGAAATAADTLASVAGEPDATGGYARQPVTRDGTGWPTIAKINGIWRALSQTITWTATGGDFSQAVNRLFLTNAASGTTGKLYGYSAALATPVSIPDGKSYQANFELYLN